MNRVLVISPHPDDEAIGCGGSLRQHVVEGDAVHVVFLTSGEAGGHGRSPEETARLREDEARASAQILGVGGFEFWRQPDGALPDSDVLVERLRAKIRAWEAQIIYVPHDQEAHPDHQTASALVRQALSVADPKLAEVIVLLFEIWTPLQRIDRVVDISSHLDAKLAAIRAHRSQCAVMSFDDAARGLNRYRAVMHSGWPPAAYAEVFAVMQVAETEDSRGAISKRHPPGEPSAQEFA